MYISTIHNSKSECFKDKVDTNVGQLSSWIPKAEDREGLTEVLVNHRPVPGVYVELGVRQFPSDL